MPATKTFRNRLYVGFNFEADRIKEFKEICWREHKSMGEKLNEMITEELQKNEVGLNNPLNIQYTTSNIKEFVGVQIPLDKFLDIEATKVIIEKIKIEDLHAAFANTKKVFQQLQARTTGKITAI